MSDEQIVHIPKLSKVLPVQTLAGQRHAATVRQQVYDQIWDELPQIVSALIDQAKGMHVEELDPFHGEINRYQKPPNIIAAKFLVERVMGATPKPKDTDESAEDFESMVKRLVKQKAAQKAADKFLTAAEEILGAHPLELGGEGGLPASNLNSLEPITPDLTREDVRRKLLDT